MTVPKKKKKITERWPWNHLVKRPKNIPSSETSFNEDEIIDRETDDESPLTGDTPVSEIDKRTPRE